MAHRELVACGEWYSNSDHMIWRRRGPESVEDEFLFEMDNEVWSKAQVHRICDKRNKRHREELRDELAG